MSNGKGSTRRPEDAKKIADNWSKISGFNFTEVIEVSPKEAERYRKFREDLLKNHGRRLTVKRPIKWKSVLDE